MSSEYEKGVREIEIFRRFIERSQLPIDKDSIEKGRLCEPDIRCVHSMDGPLAFELVEICDPNLAKFVATARPDDGRYLRTSDPSLHILAKKLLRQYSSDAPVELLCYVDGGVITPDNVLLPTLQHILSGRTFGFRRVWLLGRKDVYVAWPFS